MLSLRDAHFPKLPLDTLIHIQKFLHPSDIRSLRLTCKSLSSASYQRTVWLNALYRVCLDHGAFIPTFPVQDMTSSALEFAASTPFRFSKFLRRQSYNHSSPAQPMVTRILTPRKLPDSRAHITAIRLIPGGRFLLTYTTDHILSLWDLGFNSDAMIKPFPVAFIKLSPALVEFLVQPTSDGLGIIIVLHSEWDYDRDKWDICVYTINPASLAPTFVQKNSLISPIPSGTDGISCLSNDHFVIHFDHRVVIWNFILDTMVNFKVDMTYTYVLMSDDHIILTHEDGFSLWKIPPFLPVPANSDFFVTERTGEMPVFSCRHPFNDSAVVPSCPSDWNCPSQRFPFHFYHIVTNADFETFVAHYLMKSVPNGDDNKVPTAIPFMMGLSRPQGEDHNESCGVFPSQFCDNNVIMQWSTIYDHIDCLVFGICPVPTTRETRFPMTSTVLWSSPAKEKIQSSFCSMSGRLCVLGGERADWEIRVLDWVVPSTQNRRDMR